MKLLESFNIFFRKSGQAILTSDNVLQDVTKDYKGLFLSCQKVSTFFYNTLLKVERGLETWELIMNLSRSFNMLLIITLDLETWKLNIKLSKTFKFSLWES